MNRMTPEERAECLTSMAAHGGDKCSRLSDRVFADAPLTDTQVFARIVVVCVVALVAVAVWRFA